MREEEERVDPVFDYNQILEIKMTEPKEFDFKEISSLDEQIEVLFSCKPLPESQIKILCDKVSLNACPFTPRHSPPEPIRSQDQTARHFYRKMSVTLLAG